MLGGAHMAYEAPEVSQRILSAACSVSPVRGTVRGSWRGAVGEGAPMAGLLLRTFRPCWAAHWYAGPSTALGTGRAEGCSGRAVGR